MKKGLTVRGVKRGGIAREAGIDEGDRILGINGYTVTDILDYNFYSCETRLVIDLLKKSGEYWELEIEKDYDQDLDITFVSTGLESIVRCANRCLFCFVDQMPGGMRDSLYIRDDDYRLSFLQGSFITLTNLKADDIDRIIRLRLSPLYVSVHATNPETRIKIMGNPRAGELLRQLKTLTDGGIEIHTQAVICPGINDGTELERTVRDLSSFWPGVKSLAVVPVGLTGQRENLYPIRQFSRMEAGEIAGRVKNWQDGFLKHFGYPFVFAGDEFYFLAEKGIPPRKRYADFPQTENGVGLSRLFLDEWGRVKKKLPSSLPNPLKISLVTGQLGKRLLEPVVSYLNNIENLHAETVAVKNTFFGETVTVAGLLTGGDILKSSGRLEGSDLVILPGALLRSGSRVMIDDMTPGELEKKIGITVKTAGGPSDLVKIIKGATGD
ncbi:MAG: DUF512 domain-containing protein [Bacillota bacterium]